LLRGEKNPNAKLTDEQVIALRQRYATGGVTAAQLAREYGVSQAMVGLIIHRRNWKHLP